MNMVMGWGKGGCCSKSLRPARNVCGAGLKRTVLIRGPSRCGFGFYSNSTLQMLELEYSGCVSSRSKPQFVFGIGISH